MSQTYIIIIVCLLLAVFAIWREVGRINKKNSPFRLVAVTLSVVALACLIIPLTYNSEVDTATAKQAILLTEGFNAEGISATSNVYTLSKSVKKEYPKAKLINTVTDLASVKPAFNSIHILGYGLSDDEIDQLDSFPVQFNRPAPIQGVSAINWNSSLKPGESLLVQGRYNNTSPNTVNLALKGLGSTLDSVNIPANGSTTFELKTKPKNKGRAVYHLIAIRGKDTLSNDGVPLQVFETKPLNVLILANSPDFENKFLKDWLAVNHYGVALRSMISKDKYSQEFANIEQQSLGSLTPTLLGKFDVVFATLDVLKTMKPAEAGALKQQVQQKGLGIIVRSDSTMHSGYWLQKEFSLNKSANAGQVAGGFKIQGQNTATTKLLTDPVYIAAQSNTQPLVTDQQGRLIAGVALQGAGREVFTTLNNSHGWMLSGNEKDYTAYWSILIGKAAKPIAISSRWIVKTAVPYINGHTKIQLETSVHNPLIKINGQPVAAAQQPDMPFAYIADYWPLNAGWQQAQQGNEAIQWFYIYPQGEWQALMHYKMSADTRYYATLHSAKSVTKQIQQKVAIPVSKTYFYVLLLLACTYLWAEAKFSV